MGGEGRGGAHGKVQDARMLEKLLPSAKVIWAKEPHPFTTAASTGLLKVVHY